MSGREVRNLMASCLKPFNLVEHDALDPATPIPELVGNQDPHDYFRPPKRPLPP
jgi:hypothetical protein